MTTSTKILLAILAVLIVVGLGVGIYQLHMIGVRQTAIESQIVQQKELADGITRAMATWATKADLEQFAKDSNTNLDVIKSDLAKLNASVVAINVSTANSTGQSGNHIPSTGETKIPDSKPPTVICDGKEIPCADPYGYQSTVQQLSLNERFSTIQVPFGKVGFTASQKEPWSIDVLPRQYNSVTVLGTDENQRIYAYNKFTIHVDNKDYDVPVTTSQIKQEYPMPKFTLLNPRLYLGFDVGLNVASMQGVVGPSLNLQLSSYGKYKTQPDLSIAQVGVSYDAVGKKPNFLLTPISYNIGQHIPLMNNLYVGPFVGVNTSGNVSVGLGIHAGL